jgi:two-component system sensor histidine kinase YesM
VEYAANYIFVQNIRYDNRFTLEVNLTEEVLDNSIIPLVFQPIVENSIKHGFRKYNQQLRIAIEEERIGSTEVLIRISDNGMGISLDRAQEVNMALQQFEVKPQPEADDPDTDSGIGLRNIAERIKLKYGERYYLRICANPEMGTIVEMLIPIQ